MESYLEFELPIVQLEKRLADLKELSEHEDVSLDAEIAQLEKKRLALIDEIFSNLTPWQRVQLSRHAQRPYTQDYVAELFPDFMELQGDRAFGDDPALLGGTATIELNGKRLPILILGHQKGRTTKQKIERNFGMAKPEGYRKAIRLMRLAERAGLPVLTLIDTPGAYPGLDAEERGQSAAIAESIETMFTLSVPIVSIVIGEGGSGGALAIGIGDRVLMQENATYSVISPESCASILWSDSTLAERASDRLKINAKDLLKLKVIDGIIDEPKGGAHRDWKSASKLLYRQIQREFDALLNHDASKSLGRADARCEKFRQMGSVALTKWSR